MFSRRQPHQQPLPVAVTGAGPARIERRSLLVGAAGLLGGLALTACGGREITRGGTNGGFELDRTDDVVSPEELQRRAERVNAEAKRVARLAVTMLAADEHRTKDYNPTSRITTWTNRDGNSGRNVPGPEIHVQYDADDKILRTEQVQTVDGRQRRLATVVQVSGVEDCPDSLPELHEQARYGASYRVDASNGNRVGGLNIQYNTSDPASGVFRVDTESGAWRSNDPVGSEILVIDEAYRALS